MEALQGVGRFRPDGPCDREPFLGRTPREYLVLADLEKFESQNSGGMPAAFEAMMLSRIPLRQLGP